MSKNQSRLVLKINQSFWQNKKEDSTILSEISTRNCENILTFVWIGIENENSDHENVQLMSIFVLQANLFLSQIVFVSFIMVMLLNKNV
jgi:hypothetical protein